MDLDDEDAAMMASLDAAAANANAGGRSKSKTPKSRTPRAGPSSAAAARSGGGHRSVKKTPRRDADDEQVDDAELYDYSYAILSEDDIDDYNDLADGEINLADANEFARIMRGDGPSQPTQQSSYRSPSQPARRAGGPSTSRNETENRPGRANVAPARPREPTRLADASALMEAVRDGNVKAKEALHMTGGDKQLALILFNNGNRLEGLTTTQRQNVWTADEDELVANYTSPDEVQDILALHGDKNFYDRLV